MSFPPRREVLVYADEGVDRLGLAQTLSTLQRFLAPSCYKIKGVDASLLQKGTWKERCALLVIPGGRDLPYVSRLKGEGVAQIAAYVEEGGSYLGLCAGAYFASGFVEFQKGGPLQVLGERFLKFFPGSAVGPALGSAEFHYEALSGARAASISWQDTTLSTYYNGGCYFPMEKEEPLVDVLSRYTQREGNPPSIISCKVAEGRAVLSGVHFEFGPEALDPKSERMKQIMAELIFHEETRQKLVCNILAHLGLLTKAGPFCTY